MIFRQVAAGPMQNFSYIVGDNGEAAVIDVGWEPEKLVGICKEEGLKIAKIILTHSHYDHVQKADELASKTDAALCFHEDDFNEIKKALKNPNIKTVKLKNNGEIEVGKTKIKIIHTPGHTPGGICLLTGNKLLTGDTLFIDAIGRTDFAGGDPIKLFESLQKLKKLGDDVEIYPGHDYGETPFSTIGSQKKTNPYFKCSTKEEFLKLLGF